MMQAIAERHDNTYVSLERHMGCGIGACLSCSCKTMLGMKKYVKTDLYFIKRRLFGNDRADNMGKDSFKNPIIALSAHLGLEVNTMNSMISQN